MKKLGLVVLLTLCLVTLSGCKEEVEEAQGQEDIYESPYVKNYDFSVSLINEVYYTYHNVFAGVYLDAGVYNINITHDAPEELIQKLEANSSIEYHLVEYSYAELWTLREMVTSLIIDEEGFRGIGQSEKDNCVNLTLKTDTPVPEELLYYVETGMLKIEFTDLISTF